MNLRQIANSLQGENRVIIKVRQNRLVLTSLTVVDHF